MDRRIYAVAAVMLMLLTGACGSTRRAPARSTASPSATTARAGLPQASEAPPPATAAPASAVAGSSPAVTPPRASETPAAPAPTAPPSAPAPTAVRGTLVSAAPPRSAATAAPAVDGSRSVAVTYGDTRARRVALTFDAGADAGHTAHILDVLAAEHVTAAFGITGVWAEANPDLLRRIAAEGHQIINHTYDHASFTGLSTGARPLSREQRWAEIDRAEAIIERITGVSARPYFRPPYGDVDGSVLADVGARGYRVTAMWSVDSLGWNGIPASQITERTLRLASPGGILIFHVGSASADGDALPAIIAGLRERGYGLVSLATLMTPVE